MTSDPDSEIAIRPFEAADLPTLQHVRQAAFAPIFQSFREIVGTDIADVALRHADAEQAKLLEDICAAGSSHKVLVVTAGKTIVGFVSYTTDEAARMGEIGLNAVHPDYGNNGIATTMYAHVLARMKDLGLAVATVGTGGDPSHAPARRAYAKVGFGPAIPSVTLYRPL